MGRSGTTGLWGTVAMCLSPYRLLSGVRFLGVHVDPGEVVGGRRVLSGTAAKLG